MFAGWDVDLYGYCFNDPINFEDPEGLQGDIDLAAGWRARVDQFNTAHGASHEIHVFDSAGNEVGIFGPKGWISKHGFKGAPKNIPRNVFNRLNGINVDLLRRQGVLPPKGRMNVKAGRYMKFLGAVGWIVTIVDAAETQKRADTCGKSFYQQYIEDMYGPYVPPET